MLTACFHFDSRGKDVSCAYIDGNWAIGTSWPCVRTTNPPRADCLLLCKCKLRRYTTCISTSYVTCHVQPGPAVSPFTPSKFYYDLNGSIETCEVLSDSRGISICSFYRTANSRSHRSSMSDWICFTWFACKPSDTNQCMTVHNHAAIWQC